MVPCCLLPALCPTSNNSDDYQNRAETGSLHPKLSTLANLTAFLERHAMAIGLTLLLIGLILLPFTGGGSLMTILSGITISSSVGIGVGSGLSGAGFILLCRSFSFRLVPPPSVSEVNHTPESSPVVVTQSNSNGPVLTRITQTMEQRAPNRGPQLLALLNNDSLLKKQIKLLERIEQSK